MDRAGAEPADGRARALAEFLRERQREILERWKEAVRECSPASRLPEHELIDHMPSVLAQIIDAVATTTARPWDGLTTEARAHAHARVAAGLNLEDIVTELFLLRHVLFEIAWTHGEPGDQLRDAQAIGWAVDSAIGQSTASFVAEKQRMINTLNQLSVAAAESKSLDDLLRALLRLVVEMAEDVDTLGLFLADDDVLRLRAAVGFEEALRQDFHVRVGEGFAGRIARERKARGIQEAAQDPLVRNEVVHARGIRGLYGVPLLAESQLVGVLTMGSVSVSDFTDRDKTLLRAIADRAAAAIVQQQLREKTARLAKEREAALAILSGIYAGAPVGLAFLDRDLRFARINEVAAAIGGIPPEQHIGRRLTELFPDVPEFRFVEAQCQRVLETGEPMIDVELSGTNVPSRPYQHAIFLQSWYPVRVGDAVVGVGIVLRDITEERAAKEFRQHLLGVVGHDLRTPLSAIALSVGVLLRDETIPEHCVKTLLRAKSSADRMERIVRDLVDFTRLRVGQPMPIEPRPTDLAAVCRDTLHEAEAAHPNREFRFEVSGDTRGEWDAGRLAQAAANLVGNAITHGGSDTPVVVRVEAQDGSVTVEVVNQGPPIAPDVLPHLFEPFHRARPGEPHRGLGLGLFITREIVRRHGGSISVRSDEHETAFRIVLPRHVSA